MRSAAQDLYEAPGPLIPESFLTDSTSGTPDRCPTICELDPESLLTDSGSAPESFLTDSTSGTPDRCPTICGIGGPVPLQGSRAAHPRVLSDRLDVGHSSPVPDDFRPRACFRTPQRPRRPPVLVRASPAASSNHGSESVTTAGNPRHPWPPSDIGRGGHRAEILIEQGLA